MMETLSIHENSCPLSCRGCYFQERNIKKSRASVNEDDLLEICEKGHEAGFKELCVALNRVSDFSRKFDSNLFTICSKWDRVLITTMANIAKDIFGHRKNFPKNFEISLSFDTEKMRYINVDNYIKILNEFPNTFCNITLYDNSIEDNNKRILERILSTGKPSYLLIPKGPNVPKDVNPDVLKLMMKWLGKYNNVDIDNCYKKVVINQEACEMYNWEILDIDSRDGSIRTCEYSAEPFNGNNDSIHNLNDLKLIVKTIKTYVLKHNPERPVKCDYQNFRPTKKSYILDRKQVKEWFNKEIPILILSAIDSRRNELPDTVSINNTWSKRMYDIHPALTSDKIVTILMSIEENFKIELDILGSINEDSIKVIKRCQKATMELLFEDIFSQLRKKDIEELKQLNKLYKIVKEEEEEIEIN